MNKKKKKEIKFFFYKTVIILITSIAFVNFSFNFFKKNILETFTFSHENKKKIFLIIKEDFFNLLQNEKAFSDKEIEKIKEFIKKFN